MNSETLATIDGDTLSLSGVVSFDTTAELARQMKALPLDKVFRLDCGGMTHVDSAAVSLLLHLRESRAFSLHDVGPSLQGLLDLYGVAGFFDYERGG